VGENIDREATVWRINKKQKGETVVWLSLIEKNLVTQSSSDNMNTPEKEEVKHSDKKPFENEAPLRNRYPSRQKSPGPVPGAELPRGCAKIVKLCPSSYHQNGTIKQGYFVLHVSARVLWELTPGFTGNCARSKAKEDDTFLCILPYQFAHRPFCFPKDAKSPDAINAYIEERKDFQVGSTFPYTLSFHSMKKHATEDFQFARLLANKHPMEEMTSADKERAKEHPAKERLERRNKRTKVEPSEMDEQKIMGEIDDWDGSL
jgi:hypothetical protein